jgi:3-oxoadipate enol-lactonase
MIAEVLSDSGRGLPVVYVPGIDGTGNLLLGTAKRISREYRLLRIAYRFRPSESDLRGGRNEYTSLAGGIAELCGDLGIPRCLVIAESFGGGVGLQLALDHPELVAGMMVVNSFAYYPGRLRLWLSRGFGAVTPRPAFDLGRRWFAPRSLFGNRRDPAALAAFRALQGTFFDAGYRQRLKMIQGLDLRGRLPEIRQPVALYLGDRDRIVPSGATMSVLEAGLPDATLEVLPGAGHLILPLAEEPWEERLADLACRSGLQGRPGEVFPGAECRPSEPT